MRFYLRRNFLFLVILGFLSIILWSLYSGSITHVTNSEELAVNNNLFVTTSSFLNTTTKKTISENDLLLPKSAANIRLSKNNLKQTKRNKQPHSEQILRLRHIICDINKEYRVGCLRLLGKDSSTNSVYVPFSLIHKYFEINGQLVKQSSGHRGSASALSRETVGEIFEWSHSYSRVFYPDKPYSTTGKFLWFENYNVEIRDRVKCVSAEESVPLSTQWYTRGHYYPTQIAQYGLSHFNKNLTEIETLKKVILIEAGQLTNQLYNSTSTLYLKSELPGYLVVDFDLNFAVHHNITISIYVINNEGKELVLQYTTYHDNSIHHLEVIGNQSVKYALGIKPTEVGRLTLTRDVLIDLYKASLIRDRNRKNYRISRIESSTIGEDVVHWQSLALQTAAHDQFARAAGDWFVRSQNSFGGWDIKVRRKLQQKGSREATALILEPGWHSAMAQGQAMSLLTRLFYVTTDQRYARAAARALELFELESFKRGVKAMLFDRFVWFEEYPTTPSIYVLNGFIYSLFGLYDLSKMCSISAVMFDELENKACHRASELFELGFASLEAMLPLFDSGSGSFYDLRHHHLGGPPNLARWDYHTTHVNQLLYLNTIVRNDALQTTATRWIGYMKGHRASHN